MRPFSCLWYNALIGILMVCLAASAPTDSEEALNKKRDFSFLTIVTFQNTECTFIDRSPQRGTCFPSSECTDMGGTADGNCASGFGVCCFINANTCGSTVSENCTYIQNPDFPNAQASVGTNTENCMYTINSEEEICFLRLDFADFEIAAPQNTGSCATNDVMQITSPSGVDVPLICGINTGMHMYVETGRQTSGTTVNFLYNQVAGTAATRRYNIKVGMIPCTDASAPPPGCLQYFTANAGVVSTYNIAGARMITDQQYTNCIRQNMGNCDIQWRQAEGTTNPFAFLAAAGGNSVLSSSCMNGFVMIPNVSNRIPRHCGGTFNNGAVADANPGVVTAMGPPFNLIHVKTNFPEVMSFGYNLMYNQVGC